MKYITNFFKTTFKKTKKNETRPLLNNTKKKTYMATSTHKPPPQNTVLSPQKITSPSVDIKTRRLQLEETYYIIKFYQKNNPNMSLVRERGRSSFSYGDKYVTWTKKITIGEFDKLKGNSNLKKNLLFGERKINKPIFWEAYFYINGKPSAKPHLVYKDYMFRTSIKNTVRKAFKTKRKTVFSPKKIQFATKKKLNISPSTKLNRKKFMLKAIKNNTSTQRTSFRKKLFKGKEGKIIHPDFDQLINPELFKMNTLKIISEPKDSASNSLVYIVDGKYPQSKFILKITFILNDRLGGKYTGIDNNTKISLTAPELETNIYKIMNMLVEKRITPHVMQIIDSKLIKNNLIPIKIKDKAKQYIANILLKTTDFNKLYKAGVFPNFYFPHSPSKLIKHDTVTVDTGEKLDKAPFIMTMLTETSNQNDDFITSLHQFLKKPPLVSTKKNSTFNIYGYYEYISSSYDSKFKNKLINKLSDVEQDRLLSNICFQILYTLEVFNRIGVKHNDLHYGNILLIIKQENIFKNNLSKFNRKYTFRHSNGKLYDIYLENLGIEVRIMDFDLSCKNPTKFNKEQIKSDLEIAKLSGRNCEVNNNLDTYKFCKAFYGSVLINKFINSTTLKEYFKDFFQSPNILSNDKYVYDQLNFLKKPLSQSQMLPTEDMLVKLAKLVSNKNTRIPIRESYSMEYLDKTLKQTLLESKTSRTILL